MRDLAPFLEKIKERILLSDIIRADTSLTRKGKTFKGLCPFHKEKSPSFNVDDEKGTYHCFGCGVSGDAFNYLEAKKGFAFIESVEYLANQVGLSLPKNERKTNITKEKTDSDRSYEIMEKAALWMRDMLSRSIGQKARDYLEKRGITESSQSLFRLGYTPSSKTALYDAFKATYSIDELLKVGLILQNEQDKSIVDRFRGRLMFPIFDRRGRVIAFGGRALEDIQPKYLNSAETVLFSKSKILYAHHFAQKNVDAQKGYIVVEGYLDVISLHQNGINTAVAPLGTALTEDHAKLLWRHHTPPILCFDGDKAGYTAAIRSAKRLLPLVSEKQRLNFVFLPEEEDPDSFVRKDKQKLLNLLNTPSHLSEVLWKDLKEAHPFNTPEDQALFLKEVKDLIGQIASVDIKNAYKEYFDNQVLALKNSLKPKPSYTFKKNVPQSKNGLSLSKPQAQNKNFLILQKLLLATLIYHPYLIEQVFDKLTYVNFDESLKEVLEFLESYDGLLEKEAVIDALKLKGLDNEIRMLLDAKVLTKAPFIQKTEAEHVLLGWQEIYNRLEYSLSIQREVEQASTELKKEFDEERWKRIKELQTLRLKGPVNSNE
ncbi:MAG: DNA primase [Holosporales bacterium]